MSKSENSEDRALLEAAARAAGMKFMVSKEWHNKGCTIADGEYWNPLTDDGDALRLAVKLGIRPCATVLAGYADTIEGETFRVDITEGDAYAATRRAIVRAAASMVEGEKP